MLVCALILPKRYSRVNVSAKNTDGNTVMFELCSGIGEKEGTTQYFRAAQKHIRKH